MEINIFNESGTIAAKRICHEGQAGRAKLCGMRLVQSERHGGKSGKNEGQAGPETGRERGGFIRPSARSQSETLGVGGASRRRGFDRSR
jgi:hypothetical protein